MSDDPENQPKDKTNLGAGETVTPKKSGDPAAPKPPTGSELDRGDTVVPGKIPPAESKPPGMDAVAPFDPPNTPQPGADTPVPTSGAVVPGLFAGKKVAAGRFTLIRELGRGGMGVVWLAQDGRLREEAALKFLPPDVAADAIALDDLRRETQKSRRLAHPNIIRIHDLYESPDELPFISMEFVNGANLTHLRLQQPERCFTWEFLRPLALQLCSALEYAHSEKIIHRDLKPSNLMLDARGRLKLADFGIAATMTDSLSRVSGKDVEGEKDTSGTLLYMSPQQIRGSRPKVADDIYSLGATLYELLTSKPPFFRGGHAAILEQIKHEPPCPANERLEDFGLHNKIPDQVNATILACLSKDGNDRPKSVQAILDQLQGTPGATTSTAPAAAMAAAKKSSDTSTDLDQVKTAPAPSYLRRKLFGKKGDTTKAATAPGQPVVPEPDEPGLLTNKFALVAGLVLLVGIIWLAMHGAHSGRQQPATNSVTQLPPTDATTNIVQPSETTHTNTNEVSAQAAANPVTNLDEATLEAAAKVERIECLNHLKQIGLAFKVWAGDNHDHFPADFISASNELSNPSLLQCPSDKAHNVTNWSDVAAGNISYHRISSGTNADDTHPDVVLVQCPIHGSFLLADGSVQPGTPETLARWKVVDGVTYYGESASTNTPLPVTNEVKAVETVAADTNTVPAVTNDTNVVAPPPPPPPPALAELVIDVAPAEAELSTNGVLIAHPAYPLHLKDVAGTNILVEAHLETYSNFSGRIVFPDPGATTNTTITLSRVAGWQYQTNFAGLQQFAAKGDLDAMVQLGDFAFYGLGSNVDYPAALKWYQTAAAKNYPPALGRMGMLCKVLPSFAGNKDEMSKWFQRGTELKDPASMIETGETLQKPSPQKAVELFTAALPAIQQAADFGDSGAAVKLGTIYGNGWGVAKDDAQAAKWYRKAADAGNAVGQNNLGLSYKSGHGVTKDLSEAAKWLRKAAEAGNSAAQDNLGVMYENGQGVDKDFVQAVNWYHKSADLGSAYGQNKLGFMYQNGWGVDKDYTEASKWYRKAAEAGSPPGQVSLGVLYQNGWGLDRDYAEALKWYRQAAEADNAGGQINLAWMYENGWGTVKNFGEAVKWYRKAAEAGNTTAQNNLGVNFENGWGVTKDLDQAVQWYRKAAAGGDANAQQNLKRLGR